ncbi:putative vacuolar protein sorting-associated protein [Trypanosoma theileri]|uniref:Putative vacuolar protein sorting-associated protein n=1 Tax=Trypanosoma theileri TaxID=67003 RepID=A0A1X0P7Y3_9TRYP|nr:putative vacuolar protein sorting-associated protein [Trypanosoma theileri]ORC92941.1 putative vacuolar protein sorting-associated protein [Trypanosoma theileri]
MSNGPPNFFHIVSEYVEHILPADNTMKVLLVDEATLNIISMACSQTMLLKRGVFLVSRIDDHHQRKCMKNMRCIIFIRPQLSSVEAACQELRTPKYESYAIHFSTAAGAEFLDRLARADVESLVNRVGEVFCDFTAVNGDAFVPAAPACVLLPAFLSAVAVQRVAEGVAATFVALRRKPLVRFDQNSAFARRVATELAEILSRNAELYDYKSRDSVLLILDRSSDTLTPLLTPWIYQAMLHEHIGLHHNRLQLPEGVSEEKEYVFSQQDDDFFAANMFANWGELCNNVKAYVDKCKSTLNIDRSTATMDEIKDFMQRLPQTKTLTGSVTKHATVVSYLSSIIKKRGLLDISLLEQDMVATPNASDHWNRLQGFVEKYNRGLTSSSISNNSNNNNNSGEYVVETRDLFRLCLIYHLRYEKANQTSRVVSILEKLGPHYVNCLRKLQQYRSDKSTDELFGATGVMASIVKTFVDVGNIYTQHEPVLKRILLQLFSGKLPLDQYPYLTPPPSSSSALHTNTANSTQMSSSPSSSSSSNYKPKEVTTFMCGGFTYEEAALVNAINTGTAYTGSAANNLASGGVRAAIGGTNVLNSEEFLTLLSTHP